MRALHALAMILGTTVAALVPQLSGQEFGRWVVWMQAEQLGPEWDALRHAQLLAAAHNGGAFKRKGGGPFLAADFLRADPWADRAELTPQQMQDRLDAEYAQMVQAAEAGHG